MTDAVELLQLLAQLQATNRSELVGASSLIARQRFNASVPFEGVEGPVQRAWAEM